MSDTHKTIITLAVLGMSAWVGIVTGDAKHYVSGGFVVCVLLWIFG